MKIYKENHVNEFFQRFQQTLCFGDICGDGVEYVDQDKEYGDQERHPSRDHVRRDQERDPGHHDKHSGGEVTRDDVVRHLQWRKCTYIILFFVRKKSIFKSKLEKGKGDSSR